MCSSVATGPDNPDYPGQMGCILCGSLECRYNQNYWYIRFMWEMVQLESVNVEEGDTSGNKLSLNSHEVSEWVKRGDYILKRCKTPKEAMHGSNFVWDEKKGNNLRKEMEIVTIYRMWENFGGGKFWQINGSKVFGEEKFGESVGSLLKTLAFISIGRENFCELPTVRQIRQNFPPPKFSHVRY